MANRKIMNEKGQFVSQKTGFELMQNCDLPPPVKVFAGPEKTILSPMSNVYRMISQEDDEDQQEMEKLEVLKALRLSQTRAREAEKKLVVLAKERDYLSKFLVQESLQLFAYKQWVKLMEFQISNLEKQPKKLPECGFRKGSIWGEDEDEDEDDQKGSKNMKWFVAVALCLGFAFGCRYIF